MNSVSKDFQGPYFTCKLNASAKKERKKKKDKAKSKSQN